MNSRFAIVLLGLVSSLVTSYLTISTKAAPGVDPMSYVAGPIFGICMALGLRKKLLPSFVFVIISSIAYAAAVVVCAATILNSVANGDPDDLYPSLIYFSIPISGAMGSAILTMGLFLLHRIFSWRILWILTIGGTILAIPFYFVFENFNGDFEIYYTDLFLYIPWQVGIAVLIAQFFGEDKKITKSARRKTGSFFS